MAEKKGGSKYIQQFHFCVRILSPLPRHKKATQNKQLLKTVLCFIKYKKAEKPLATWNVFKEALPLVDRGAEQVRQASDQIITKKYI